MKTLYVGNVPCLSSEAHLRELFSQLGAVHSITLINNRATGQSRGFGFIEMEDEVAGLAITMLNNCEFMGRQLRVSEARLRRPQPPRLARAAS